MIKTDVNEKLLEQVFGLYQDAELKMLEKVAKRAKRGAKDGWAEQKLQDTIALREEIQTLMADTSALSKVKTSEGIIEAYLTGVRSAEKDMKYARTAMEYMIPEHIQRLVLETSNLIEGTSFQILRNVDDVYRQIQAETSTGVLMGTDTRLQATQEALNRFADAGITSFVDKAGRRWMMDTYAEMVTRTVTARAALQGHLDRQLELGNDLIKISSIATTCPICSRWQGKVLSITARTPGYPSLESAKADGLFHPNCKHTILAYFPEIDDAPEADHSNNDWLYQKTQEQRKNERMIRKWKRREAVAMDPASKAFASQKVRMWQQVQRDLIDETGLRRKYVRESIKARTGVVSKKTTSYAGLKPLSKGEPIVTLPEAKVKKMKAVASSKAVSKKIEKEIKEPKKIDIDFKELEYGKIDEKIQKILEKDYQKPGEFLARDLTKLEDEIQEFTAGMSGIPYVTKNLLEGIDIPAGYASYTDVSKQLLTALNNALAKQTKLYRVEALGTYNKDLKVGDSYLSGIRSYTKDRKFIDEAMDPFGDVAIENPVVFETVGDIKSLNIEGYSMFDTQRESITAGMFEVLSIEEKNGYRLIKIKQKELPKMKVRVEAGVVNKISKTKEISKVAEVIEEVIEQPIKLLSDTEVKEKLRSLERYSSMAVKTVFEPIEADMYSELMDLIDEFPDVLARSKAIKKEILLGKLESMDSKFSLHVAEKFIGSTLDSGSAAPLIFKYKGKEILIEGTAKAALLKIKGYDKGLLDFIDADDILSVELAKKEAFKKAAELAFEEARLKSPIIANLDDIPTLKNFHDTKGKFMGKYGVDYGAAADVDEANDVIKRMIAISEPKSRVPDQKVLKMILNDGRFKSQHEINSSKGTLDPEYRKRAAKKMFGVDTGKALDSDYEIYGYLWKEDYADDILFNDSAEGYGDVIVKFKKDIMQRTTFTIDDSLGPVMNDMMVPSLANEITPSWRARSHYTDQIKKMKAVADEEIHKKILDELGVRYIEAQYHGGVSIDDIEEVVYTYREFLKGIDEDLVEKLKEKGIKVGCYKSSAVKFIDISWF